MVKGGLNGGTDRGAAVVRFENVGLRYGMGPEILKDVSFTLGRGSFSFLTGPSGAGKSSLVDRLAALYRRQNQRVGIIAVDPTSPFSGGAILGDRIRMGVSALIRGSLSARWQRAETSEA